MNRSAGRISAGRGNSSRISAGRRSARTIGGHSSSVGYYEYDNSTHPGKLVWFLFFVVVFAVILRLTKKGTMFYFHLGLSSHNRIERTFGILRMSGIIPLLIVVTIKRFAFARFVVHGVFCANVNHNIFSWSFFILLI